MDKFIKYLCILVCSLGMILTAYGIIVKGIAGDVNQAMLCSSAFSLYLVSFIVVTKH